MADRPPLCRICATRADRHQAQESKVPPEMRHDFEGPDWEPQEQERHTDRIPADIRDITQPIHQPTPGDQP